MIERVAEIQKQAEAEITAASSSAALEELRVQYLGRKAELPQLLRDVAQLPPDLRGEAGRTANEARQALEAMIETAAARFEAAEMSAALESDNVDITLPGSPAEAVGHHHLLSATRREIEDVFCGLGYSVVEGPEVETVHRRWRRRARSNTAAHSHLTDADPDHGADATADRTDCSRPRLPS